MVHKKTELKLYIKLYEYLFNLHSVYSILMLPACRHNFVDGVTPGLETWIRLAV